MQLLTKDDVLKAFRAEEVTPQAEGETRLKDWLDSETRWGDYKRSYRLCDEHNTWLTYLKIVLRRIS